MPGRQSQQSSHLLLVEHAAASDIPARLSVGPFRDKVEQLVDVLIEIMDVLDGDADCELVGDESEDSDGV